MERRCAQGVGRQLEVQLRMFAVAAARKKKMGAQSLAASSLWWLPRPVASTVPRAVVLARYRSCPVRQLARTEPLRALPLGRLVSHSYPRVGEGRPRNRCLFKGTILLDSTLSLGGCLHLRPRKCAASRVCPAKSSPHRICSHE